MIIYGWLITEIQKHIAETHMATTTLERARLSCRAVSEPISTFTRKVSMSILLPTPL